MVPSRFTPPFTPTQQKVLALIPKVTAVPSLVGSAYIIQHVLRKRQSQRKTYHRILLVMSAMDFLYALKCFMSTWAIPSELAIWGAGGSIRTCDAWGFLGHGASLSSAVYNGSLAIYFSLTIAFNCSERTLHRWYGEFFLHAVPLAVGWSTAIASLLLELNNPIGWTCWIGTYPPGCGLPEAWSPPCERGSIHEVDVYRWVLFHAELWFVFIVCAVALGIMVTKVRERERAVGRYDFRRQSEPDLTSGERTKLSRKVSTQALLYIVFFFVTWIFPMVQFLVANQTGYLLFPLLVLTTIFNPLQGLYDAIIYARPRYLQYRERERMATRRSTLVGIPSRVESLVRCLTTSDDKDVVGEIMPDDVARVRTLNMRDSSQGVTPAPGRDMTDRGRVQLTETAEGPDTCLDPIPPNEQHPEHSHSPQSRQDM